MTKITLEKIETDIRMMEALVPTRYSVPPSDLSTLHGITRDGKEGPFYNGTYLMAMPPTKTGRAPKYPWRIFLRTPQSDTEDVYHARCCAELPASVGADYARGRGGNVSAIYAALDKPDPIVSSSWDVRYLPDLTVGRADAQVSVKTRSFGGFDVIWCMVYRTVGGKLSLTKLSRCKPTKGGNDNWETLDIDK